MLYAFVEHGLSGSLLLIVDVLLQFWDVNGHQLFVSKQLMLMLVLMMFDDLTASFLCFDSLTFALQHGPPFIHDLPGP